MEDFGDEDLEQKKFFDNCFDEAEQHPQEEKYDSHIPTKEEDNIAKPKEMNSPKVDPLAEEIRAIIPKLQEREIPKKMKDLAMITCELAFFGFSSQYINVAFIIQLILLIFIYYRVIGFN